MKLSVMERLILLNLLPNEGNFTNLKLLRVAREVLSFTEDENKALNFHQEGDQVKWNDFVVVDTKTGEVVDPSAIGTNMDKQIDAGVFEKRPSVEGREIEIGEVVTLIIVTALKALEAEEKLRDEHISIYEKFVG